MSRRNSLSRFSFSASNISSPMAESTKIGSPRSSEYELLGGRQFLHNNERSVIVENNKFQSYIPRSISSVDPKTYTDVQSRGLVSRIIKYHDNRKLNRSMSSSNLYNKPGEFPIVHLKKNEIRYSPKRNQIFSGTRIAPPDKSVFQANTRSSILRSGMILSAQALEQTDDKGLKDNEPIVLSEGDIDPSRNSLDALKEISRKRINSDDIDSNDAYKKYRKEYVYDEYNSFGSKRQRESQTSPKSANEGNVEQIVKKRMFRKNNDILSSLSSSLHINSPKRKICDLQPVTTSPRRSPVPPSAKQQCNDNNYIRPVYNEKLIVNAKPQEKNVTAVSPRPPIARAYIEKEVIKKTVEQKPKLTLFNARYDTKPSAGKLDREPEKYTNGNVLDDEEEDDTAGISFVKPKNNKLSLKTTNAALEHQKKTKLQMMLSFLNGDVEDEGRDEVDVTSKVATSQENKVSEPAKSSSDALETQKNVQTTSGGFTFGNASTTVSNTSSALTVTTSINNKPIMSNQTTVSSTGFSFGLASTTSTSTAPTVQTTSTTVAPPTTTAGFSFGSNTTSQPPTSVTTSSSSKIASPTSTFGGFSKPNPEPTSTVSNSAATNTSTFSFGLSKTTSSEIGQPAKPNTGFSFNTASSASSTPSIASTSAPTITPTAAFSFGGGSTGTKPATTSSTSIFGNSSSVPSQSISFDVSTKTNENQPSTQTSATSNPWTMQKPSLPGQFGTERKSGQNQSGISTEPKPVFGNNSAPATFGSTFSSFAPKTSGSNEIVKPQPVFGADIGAKPATTTIFGGSSDTKTTASSSANLFSQPAFSFVGSSGSNNNQTEAKPNAAPSFSFGGNTSKPTVAKPTQSATPFAFGGSSATSNDNTAQNSSLFAFGGQKTDPNRNNNNNNNNSNVNPGFSFNANQPKPSFNAPNPENKPSFGFGQSAPPAATDNKPSFSFSQNSAPAPANTDNKPSFNFGQSTASTNADNKPNFSFNQNAASTPSAFSFKPVASSNTAGSGSNNDLNKTFGVGGGGDGKSIFGAASSNGPAEVKPFAFGGAASDKNNTQPASNLFGGSTSTPNKSFSFTGKSFPSANPNMFGSPSSSGNNNNSNNNNNNNAASIFGGSNGPANNNQPFAFGGSSSSSNQQASSPPFGFGASSSNTNQAKESSSPASFGFGGSAANTNQGKENSKPFAFGASNSNSQPAMSFGNSSSNKPTMTVFGSQQAPAAASNPFAPPPSVNPFSAGPGGSPATQTNSYGRTIRTATRRLK